MTNLQQVKPGQIIVWPRSLNDPTNRFRGSGSPTRFDLQTKGFDPETFKPLIVDFDGPLESDFLIKGQEYRFEPAPKCIRDAHPIDNPMVIARIFKETGKHAPKPPPRKMNVRETVDKNNDSAKADRSESSVAVDEIMSPPKAKPKQKAPA